MGRGLHDEGAVITGFSGELGKTVSPPSSTSDKYMSIVAIRWPPFLTFSWSWK
jgi:hypothetical protein